MRNALLVTLSLLWLNLQGQQCVSLEPRVMGLPAFEVDLSAETEKTLPIVFHVMHTGEALGEGANITDEAILETLDLVNDQFRKVPGSTGDGIGVDTKIDFCLVRRDPDGSPTSGVTRHDLSNISAFVSDGIALSGLNDGAPDLQVKEIACWDVDEYVNVYIVPEINGNNGGGGVQGYAYTGATGNCLDGVVILANRMVTTQFNFGKILTHELGHYLSLQHTFYNTLNCGDENNCQTQGDGVCDTPVTTTNNFCDSPACEGAMVENYMDYTGESCRDSFTEGQAEKMHSYTASSRSELLTAPSCVPPVDIDLALENADYLTPFCQQSQNIVATVSNLGNLLVGSASVVVGSDGVYYTEDVYDIEPGETVQVPFENIPLDGVFWVSVIAEGDEYEDNNEFLGFVDYLAGSLWEMDFTTGFFGAETSWLLEGEGVYLESPNYPSGINTYSYEGCLYSGCYTLTIYDLGGDGMPYGGDVVMTVDGVNVPVDIAGDWSELVIEFCLDANDCPFDLDGNGNVGNGDLLLLLTGYGCTASCQYDLNGDGTTDVNDLLTLLNVWGLPCPALDNLPPRSLPIEEQIYDLSGRRVYRPLDNLPAGFYIVASPEGVTKLYKQ